MKKWGFSLVCFFVLIHFAYAQNTRTVSGASELPPTPEQASVNFDSVMKHVLNVKDFGAKGDGKTDDTDTFQKALNAAEGQGSVGGRVFAPQGIYMISKHLIIPSQVSLEGIWQIPTAWSEYKGTTLLAVEGEGNPDGTPFITLHNNSLIKGITIFYPNQVTANQPKSYPWTIASGGGDNSSIIDVLIVNPYQAVDFGTKPAGRHYIRNLYAQPFYKGLFIDQCYDVGRVENVHFWPFLTCNNQAMKSLQDWIVNNGTAFIFGRTDWEYVYNTFCWGYKIGYHFIKTKNGPANGNFLGIGADGTQRAVVVDECAPYGLLITNGEFVSMFGDDPTQVDIKESNTGVIQFQNCAFWGDSKQIASVKGYGTVTFNNCNFCFWTYEKKNLPAIDCFGGNLIITGCNFNRAGDHVRLNHGTNSAVVSSNRFAGVSRIINDSDADVQIGLNSQSRIPKEEKDAIVIDDSDPSPNFRTEGKWFFGMGGNDYKESTHWAYKGKGESKAFFTPTLKKSGMYQVYIWYGGDPTGDHATDLPVTIRYKDGEKTIKINLKENFGKWNLLGNFYFKKGNSGYIMLSNNANWQVVADAVKFLPVKK